LSVKYSVSGTARPRKDYLALPGTVSIPKGKRSVTVMVIPVNDGTREKRETVIVRIKSDDSYKVGSPAHAKVFIQDDD